MRVLGTQLGLLSWWLLEARSLASLSVTCRFLTCSVIAGEEAKAIAPRYPQTVFEGARDALAAPYSDELTAR